MSQDQTSSSWMDLFGINTYILLLIISLQHHQIVFLFLLNASHHTQHASAASLLMCVKFAAGRLLKMVFINSTLWMSVGGATVTWVLSLHWLHLIYKAWKTRMRMFRDQVYVLLALQQHRWSRLCAGSWHHSEAFPWRERHRLLQELHHFSGTFVDLWPSWMTCCPAFVWGGKNEK